MNKKFRIALAGNPNCGKTSIFNTLTGTRQHVGNYPGVTVESKTGTFVLGDYEIELVDLPGVYSLSSSSPEEDVVFQELTQQKIDLIINVIDSSIPRRSMYLTTQLAELHIPMLLAFNMSDDAHRKGLKFNISKLEKYFGSPIVQTIGCRSGGIKRLLRQLQESLLELDNHGTPMFSYGEDIDDAIHVVSQKIDDLKLEQYQNIPSRFYAIKLLEHDRAVMSIDAFKPVFEEVDAQIQHLWKKHAIEAETFMADRRYAMLAGACSETISMTQEKRREISDKIDLVMTNKFFGLPLFLIIIYCTFFITFTCADPFMGYIETFFGWVANWIGAIWDPGLYPFWRSMVIDGMIGGVGGVIVFLPNILFLFFVIALLEDSGYMSRAAFVMDGVMRQFGLQGRSFVPLVLGFGCSVPAIMATRTIESERDRKVTIMVLPLMSCGARLPIYSLIIPAFFAAKYQPLAMWGIYVIGVVVALVAALIMRSTLFKGEGEVYLMELPPYRMPTLKSLFLHMWDRGKMYLHKAGTIILAASVILYICNTYPEKTEFSKNYEAEIEQIKNDSQLSDLQVEMIKNLDWIDSESLALIQQSKFISNDLLERFDEFKNKGSEEQKNIFKHAQEQNDKINHLKNEQKSELMTYTITGRIGRFLEPCFQPIGFDWKLTTASIGALAAKEVFVSQLGILYSEGETDEESISLREHLIKNYTPLQAFCIMLFCLLSIPCLATLAIIKRELNSWGYAILEGGGLFILAYVLTFIVYQLGMIFKIGVNLI